MRKTEHKKRLLIIEDDLGLQSQLRWHFEDYEIAFAENRADAIAALRLEEAPVIIQDLGLPPDRDGVEEGFRCITDLLRLSPHAKIVVMTGKVDYDNALRSIDLGAYDYCEKPVDPGTLDLIVRRAFTLHELENENRRLHRLSQQPLSGLITNDPQMLKICQMLEKVSPTDATCSLLGESGTGKEVIARAIHQLSTRYHHRFVAINCAAVPENLIESELFGHERGAFTGAAKQTLGKVEMAQGGTLFLDEIGDMPLGLQAKLLRFLQERVIERVGGREEIPVDVRVVCATNKNLKRMVDEGTFREDLFYRLCEMNIEIPPLRERQGDAILLGRHFLLKYAKAHNPIVRNFTPDAATAINQHQWPGNVRELENKVKRAVIMAENKQITRADLGLETDEQPWFNLRQVRREAERQAILKAVAITNNNVSAAAKLLGITRPTFYDLVKKHDIIFRGHANESALQKAL